MTICIQENVNICSLTYKDYNCQSILLLVILQFLKYCITLALGLSVTELSFRISCPILRMLKIFPIYIVSIKCMLDFPPVEGRGNGCPGNMYGRNHNVITTTVECKCKSYFAAFAVLRANQLCFFLECAFVLGGTA